VTQTQQLRSLMLVLGDQLDLDASAFDDFDPAQDAVWMAEVAEESTHVWSSRQRIAMFLSAMRHYAEETRKRGRRLHYQQLACLRTGNELSEAAPRSTRVPCAPKRSPEIQAPPEESDSLSSALEATILEWAPSRLVMTAPGDWRVLKALRTVAARHGLPLLLRDDRRFFTTVREFSEHASRHGGALRMETFYREQRLRHDILVETDPAAPNGRGPAGQRWNFDTENRASFGRKGPGILPEPLRFAPDAITQEVIALVNERFAGHPGHLRSFAWPVTRAQALLALQDFIQNRLPRFGAYQDAMWPGQPWLYHSQLAAAMNLGLLDPHEVVAAATAAFDAGTAPLPSVEGFVRQILGWREYVRGIYWTQMPHYLERNALNAQQPLPDWYWTGETDMVCLRDTIRQTLEFGYAHHIQRLMVTGLYALLLGVRPQEVHRWYLAVYVDAVEWVELPNTLGMSQYADGGLMGSKPYVASGRYIERMGGPCRQCRFDPGQRTGDGACPFTTLYWDFLERHQGWLSGHERMAAQVRNLERMEVPQRDAIRLRANAIRAGGGAPPMSSAQGAASGVHSLGVDLFGPKADGFKPPE
jgi:deoxyribodipyrimidine photolyase-related protein